MYLHRSPASGHVSLLLVANVPRLEELAALTGRNHLGPPVEPRFVHDQLRLFHRSAFWLLDRSDLLLLAPLSALPCTPLGTLGFLLGELLRDSRFSCTGNPVRSPVGSLLLADAIGTLTI